MNVDNVYFYGNGQVAQYRGAQAEYFLGDALGSVRQMVDANGNVVLAKDYQPYGEELGHTGSGYSSYGFTAEMTDLTGLVYLRARYYAPWQGRFLSRDVWDGDYNQPLSLNKWLYASANPINLVDPAGTNPIDDIAEALLDKTEACFNRGDLKCVWRSYYLLAVGGNTLGYKYSANHLFNFLFKLGDLEYPPIEDALPYGLASDWVQRSKAAQDQMPTIKKGIEALLHIHAQNGDARGAFETKHFPAKPNPISEPDVYYAMNGFDLWAKVEYDIRNCSTVRIKTIYHFQDPYDWHEGLVAGGGAVGVKGFKDVWAAALHDAGLALEYEVSRYWYGIEEYLTFPSNWLSSPVPLPAINSSVGR